MLEHVLNMSDLLQRSPILFEKPIYGESKPSFTDFVAPGIMVHMLMLAYLRP
jgi:hypothetical protein